MTKIPWCDEAWNPVVGCRPVSEGCRHCYAARMAHRGMCEQHRGLTKMGKGGPVWNGKVNLVHRALEIPQHWRKPRRIFVDSMFDLFYERVPFEYVAAIFGVMTACPQHTFLCLTKREHRAAQFTEWFYRDRPKHKINSAIRRFVPDLDPIVEDMSWPLPNVQLIVSTEDQETYDDRVHVLVHSCLAAVKGVSVEPMLGPIKLRATGRLHLQWVVIGGESGHRARPMKRQWVYNLIRECKDADIAVYVKQTGDVLARELDLESRSGSDPKEWPEFLRIQEYPTAHTSPGK